MTERRSTNTRHWLLADGSCRAETHIRPIHYQAADGSWQPIDSRLTASAKPGFALSNETNALKTFFSAGAAGWVRLEAGETAVSVRALGTLHGVSSSLDNHLQFTEVGGGVSISYTVEPGRLKELITLSESVPVPAFRYVLALEGLSAHRNADNSVTLMDATGETALMISAPWMEDAAGRISGNIIVDLVPSDDGLVSYTMRPDPKWLSNAQYPVTIDPTITLGGTAVNLVFDDDDYFNHNDSFWAGLSSDYGDYSPQSGPYLVVGAQDYYHASCRSVLSFSIGGLPPSSYIRSATLSLLAHHATGDPNMKVQIYRINKPLDFSPSSAQAPVPNYIGVTGTDLNPYISVKAPLEPNFWGAYKQFDVAPLVQNWADDRTTDCNFLIRDIQEDISPWQRSSARVFFNATESTLGVNYVTYSTPPFVDAASFAGEPDASPAVYDMDGDGHPELALASGEYQTTESVDPNFDGNPNRAYLYQLYWYPGMSLSLNPLWIQSDQKTALRDAPTNLAIGRLAGVNRVVVTASQDNHSFPFKPADWPVGNSYYFASRFYVWNQDASLVPPWTPWAILTDYPNEDSATGLVHGHQAAAPVLHPLGASGNNKLIQAGQGYYAGWTAGQPPYYKYGSLRVWSDTGMLLMATDPPNPPGSVVSLPKTDDPFDPMSSNFALSIAPVIANLNGHPNCIVAATEDGRLYAWDSAGVPVPGWFPNVNAETQTEPITGLNTQTRRAPITKYNSMAAVDFGNPGSINDDIVVCTGDWREPPVYGNYSFGKVYRFSGSSGSAIWSWPSGPPRHPGLSSGIAVGRIRRSYPNRKCIVVGDVEGRVIALDPSLPPTAPDNPIWIARTSGAVLAQPAIGDVNGDGYQDVVVGSTGGFVYAFDGDTGALLWRVPMKITPINNHAYREKVTTTPTFAKVSRWGVEQLYLVVMSSAQDIDLVKRVVTSVGSMTVINCGYVGTQSRYDWPQYQHDAQRTGKAIADE